MWIVHKIIMNNGAWPVNTSVICDDQTLVVEPAASMYLYHKATKGAEEATIHNTASTLAAFFNEVSREKKIEGWRSVSEKAMGVYLVHKLSKERGVSAASLDVYISRLKNFYKWTFEYGWLKEPASFTWTMPRNIEFQIREAKAKNRGWEKFNLKEQYISPEEFGILLKYIQRVRSFEQERDTLAFKLAYEVGLRVSEVVSRDCITPAKIHEAVKKAERDNHEYLKIQIVSKKYQSSRNVVIHNELKRDILRFIRGSYSANVKGLHSSLVCKRGGGLLTTESISGLFRKSRIELIKGGDLDETAKLQWSSGRSFHSLRHGYATNLATESRLSNGEINLITVQQRLGHRYESTTWVYVHFDAVLNKLPDLEAKAQKVLKASREAGQRAEMKREMQGE